MHGYTPMILLNIVFFKTLKYKRIVAAICYKKHFKFSKISFIK